MRRLFIGTGLAIVLGALLTWLGGPVFEVVWGLASGWVAYAARVLPRVRVSWDGVLTAVVCLALFTVGLHRTLGWLYREVQTAGDATVECRRTWSVRWTLSLVVLIVLMFVVGISATGIVHQAGWLISARGSLVEERVRSRYRPGESASNLKEIGLASSLLRMEFEASKEGDRPRRDLRQSWMTDVLSGSGYILGGQLRRDLPWNAPQNSAYFKGVVPIFLNPDIRVVRSPEGYALSHYAGNVHVLGRDRAGLRIGAGRASNTILAGEVAERFKPWGDPTNVRDPGLGVNQVADGFGGPSGLGANLLFMDGSVRFFKNTTSHEVIRRLSMPKPRDE
jgi:prepilin-type processing-associated H-X9-DG protein